jgi:hypothetical protein
MFAGVGEVTGNGGLFLIALSPKPSTVIEAVYLQEEE